MSYYDLENNIEVAKSIIDELAQQRVDELKGKLYRVVDKFQKEIKEYDEKNGNLVKERMLLLKELSDTRAKINEIQQVYSLDRAELEERLSSSYREQLILLKEGAEKEFRHLRSELKSVREKHEQEIEEIKNEQKKEINKINMDNQKYIIEISAKYKEEIENKDRKIIEEKENFNAQAIENHDNLVKIKNENNIKAQKMQRDFEDRFIVLETILKNTEIEKEKIEERYLAEKNKNDELSEIVEKIIFLIKRDLPESMDEKIKEIKEMVYR